MIRSNVGSRNRSVRSEIVEGGRSEVGATVLVRLTPLLSMSVVLVSRLRLLIVPFVALRKALDRFAARQTLQRRIQASILLLLRNR